MALRKLGVKAFDAHLTHSFIPVVRCSTPPSIIIGHLHSLCFLFYFTGPKCVLARDRLKARMQDHYRCDAHPVFILCASQPEKIGLLIFGPYFRFGIPLSQHLPLIVIYHGSWRFLWSVGCRIIRWSIKRLLVDVPVWSAALGSWLRCHYK